MSILESDGMHVIGSAKTRWVERHKTYDNFCILYKFIISTFESICKKVFMKISMNILPEIKETWSWDKETVSRAQGLYVACRRFDRLIAFLCLFNGLEPLKLFFTKLQKKK